MMMPIPHQHPLHRYFAGLVESCFEVELGLCDPPLVDYIAGLLTEFIHIERVNVLQDGSGRAVEEVAAMLEKAAYVSSADAEAERRRLEAYRHIGDFTLFWTGVYPERLRRLRRIQSRDVLLDYCDQGKRSYAIASDLADESVRPPASLLRRLSDEFESCAYGLTLVRKSWEQGGPTPGAGVV